MSSEPEIAPAIATPCVKVCFVDPKNGVCVGCFRTMEELGRWTRFSDAERAQIMSELPARKTAYREGKTRG